MTVWKRSSARQEWDNVRSTKLVKPVFPCRMCGREERERASFILWDAAKRARVFVHILLGTEAPARTLLFCIQHNKGSNRSTGGAGCAAARYFETIEWARTAKITTTAWSWMLRTRTLDQGEISPGFFFHCFYMLMLFSSFSSKKMNETSTREACSGTNCCFVWYMRWPLWCTPSAR